VRQSRWPAGAETLQLQALRSSFLQYQQLQAQHSSFPFARACLAKRFESPPTPQHLARLAAYSVRKRPWQRNARSWTCLHR
jgi:hypothetical protein